MKKMLIILIMIVCTDIAYAPRCDQNQAGYLEIWLADYAKLTPENLKLALELNGIMSPEIVFAQSRLETGNFSSVLCRVNNNLFGMKKAAVRETTASGSTDNDYATYLTWYDSVKDLKLFQSWYQERGRNLTNYLAFLKEIGYAEDVNYLVKLTELCTI